MWIPANKGRGWKTRKLEKQGLGVQIRGGLKNWALHRHREGLGGWPEQLAGGGVRKMREGVNNQGRLK